MGIFKKLLFFSFLSLFTYSLAQTIKTPSFSKKGGFYSSEFELKLSHKNPSLRILYTIDGSEPNINNLKGKIYQYKKQYPQFPGDKLFGFYEDTIKTFLYKDPIIIYDRTYKPNRIANISTSFERDPYFPNIKLDKSFVIKAKACDKNNICSQTISSVYFVNRKFTLPVININVDSDAFYGYDKGLLVAGRTFDDWKLQKPYNLATVWSPANYWTTGSSSEVPVNVIYFDNNQEKVNQTIGIRTHGNGTRFYKNRSLRIYAKSDYGKKNLKYSFFENYPYDSFKRLILRNSGTDTEETLFRDALVQKINESLNFDTQNYQPVVTFVNGEYYGIYNLRERYDEKYIERVYNIKEKDVDLLGIENSIRVKLGDSNAYLEAIAYFKSNTFENEEKYKKALSYVDEINFTDYHIAEIFAANNDWPYNNNEFFRKKINYDPKAPYGNDGRFRWLMKDLDGAFKLKEHNTLTHAMNSINYAGNPYINYILLGLLTNNNYKNYFINRFSDLLNTIYTTEHLIECIDLFQNRLRPEMQKNIIRWNLIKSMQDWENNVEVLRDFARFRPKYQMQHINDDFKLKGNYTLTAETNSVHSGFVKVNSIEINNTTIGINDNYKSWSGKYFKDIPVTLEAIAMPDYKFVRWEGDTLSNERKIVINPQVDYRVKAIFIKDKNLGVGDLDKIDFSIYPNPAKDYLNIHSNSSSPIEYKITSMLGQIVDQNKISSKQINVTNLEKGLYVIELTQGSIRVTKKFIKN